ncbi:MAG: amidohydrolase [Dehalococcoidia bacterium]
MVSDDLAVVNARMLTMEPTHPIVEAALVRRGRIALVGTTREVLDAADRVPVYDCGGRVVVPGFIDAHCHLEMTCLAATRCVACHTPPMKSLSEIAEALRRKVAETPPGQWVIGRSSFTLHAKVAEGRMFTRQDLDAITERHPLLVFSGFHVAMLNTLGMKELGLWDRTDNPPRGVTINKDDSGAPTGVVTEIWDLLPAFSAEDTRDALKSKVKELFVSQGVTTAYTIPFSSDDIRSIQGLQAAGEFPLRIRLYYHVPHLVSLDSLLATGLQTGFGNDMLRFGGVKIFVDGTGHDGYGNRLLDFKWTQQELNDFVARAHQDGLQLLMHVSTIPSIQMAATAVEEAVRKAPTPHRHRIEHGADNVQSLEDMRRLRDLGIGLVATPQFIYSAGDSSGRRPPKFTRLRTLLDEGFEVIGASDSTGTVPDGIAPLFNIACAAVRRTVGGKIMTPEERITAEEGLKMFTIWAAKSGFEEADKGSIAVGKLGDFAVLSADPLQADAEELYDIQVEATILGGQVVYER